MKHVILALLILFAAQPVKASFCSMDMNMGDMDMGMDHVMQQESDAPYSGSDCCNHEQPGSTDSCDPQLHCGAAPAGVAVLDASLDSRAVPVNGLLPSFKNRPLSPSFDSPLYRPPIS
jgi:hypothetical protein